MLTDRQILNLLNRCSQRAGKRLGQLRRELAGVGGLPAVWELLVLDAALSCASAEHAPDGRLDILFPTPTGKLWLEATLDSKPLIMG